MTNSSGECKIIAIGEGDACVAKGFAACSLAFGTAMRGSSVILVDADPEGGNAHTLLGIDSPERTIDGFHKNDAGAMRDFLIPTAEERLHLLCGSAAFFKIISSEAGERQKLIEGIRSLEADFAFINTGSGAAGAVDIVSLADTGIIATGPSQDALRRAFVLLRRVVQRRLLHLSENGSSLRVAIESAIDERKESGNIGAILSLIRERDEGMYGRAVKTLQESPFRLLLTGEGEIDGERIAKAFSAAAQQYLKVGMPFLGSIRYGSAEESARGQVSPLVIAESVRDAASSDDVFLKIMEEPARSSRGARVKMGEPKGAASKKTRSPRKYQLGINEEVDIDGVKLHVQTEDLGVSKGKILTIVFRGGEVLYSETASYRAKGEGTPEGEVKEKVSLQHKTVIEQVRSGMLSDRIFEEREVKR